MADLQTKNLQKKQREALLRLQCAEKRQIQVLSDKLRLTYEKAETELERGALLTIYVQKMRQLQQTLDLKRQRLLYRQVKQREKLVEKLTIPAELDIRKRMKHARQIIEVVTKSHAPHIPI